MTKKKPFIRLRPKLDPAGEGYPQPMRGLLTLGKPKEDTDYAAWAEQLRGHVPQLIQMALDDNLNSRSEKDRAVWAPLHALSILAELAPVQAAEPLLEILAWDDDWTTEPLLAYYGRVGKAAAPLLKQRVLDTDLESTTRGRAVAALQSIAETHAEERDDIVNFLVHYLEQETADNPDEEYVVTSAVLTLTDLRAAEALPAIERAFEEDRVETFMITLDNVKRAFDPAAETEEESDEDDAPLPGVHLSLHCLSCNRDRRYSFDRAYFDMGVVENSKDSAMGKALYTPEPVVCPRCGAVEQYELGTFGHIAITATLTALMSNQPNPIPDLKLMNFPPAPWGWLPPREALARYQAEIAAKPADLELRVHYGDALAMVDEHEAAIEQFEQALLIDPVCGNALFGLADQTTHAEIADAIAVWERIERDAEKLKFLEADVVDAAHLRKLAQRALTHLRAGERLPPLARLDLDDEEAIDGASAPEGEAAQNPALQQLPGRSETFVTPERGEYGKVGRNEPCPCGSGKKYKQCHGRK